MEVFNDLLLFINSFFFVQFCISAHVGNAMVNIYVVYQSNGSLEVLDKGLKK